MTEQSESNNGHDDPVEEPIAPLLQAYIDRQVQEAYKHNPETRKRFKNSWKSASPITKGSFIMTLFIAAATIAYAIVAWRQLDKMSETNRITQAALERANQNSSDASNQFQAQIHHFDASLGQTQMLATATKTQADNSEIFFREDGRAWVEIEKVEKSDTYPPDPPFLTIFKYDFVIKNFGKTVATNVKVQIDNTEGDASFGSNATTIRMFQDSLFRDSKSGKRIRPMDKPGPQAIAPGGVFRFHSIRLRRSRNVSETTFGTAICWDVLTISMRLTPNTGFDFASSLLIPKEK
jgi:hypothetical protein